MAKKKELSDSFDSMFIHDDITAQEPEQKPKAKKPAAKEQPKEEPKTKTSNEGSVFSARLDKDIWAQWKAYNEAKNTSKGAIGKETEKAFVEYMKKHPLKAEQTEEYEIYLRKYSK